MNNKEFISELAHRTDMSVKNTTMLTNALVDEIASCLENEQTLNIVSFGTFESKMKKERILVNPQTKQRMLVPPKITISFKPNTSFKDDAK